MDEISKRVSRRSWSTSMEGGEARQHRLPLREINVADFAAVAPVPAEGCPLEPVGLRVEQEEEL